MANVTIERCFHPQGNDSCDKGRFGTIKATRRTNKYCPSYCEDVHAISICTPQVTWERAFNKIIENQK